MQQDAAVELLARNILFSGLSEDLLASITQRGEWRHVGAGEYITVKGSPSGAAIFLIEGLAEFHNVPDGLPGNKFGPGQAFDPMAMFIEVNQLNDVVAVEDSLILVISRAEMCQLMLEKPYLAAHFARNVRQSLISVADTLRALDEELSESLEQFEKVAGHESVNGYAGGVHGSANGNGISHETFGSRETFGGQPADQESFSFPAAEENAQPDQGSEKPFSDLLASLRDLTGQSDQTRPRPEHDQTAYPSPEPRRSHAA